MNSPLLPRHVRERCVRSPLPPAVILGTNVTGLAEARALAAHGVLVIGVDELVRRYTSFSSAWAALVVTDAFNTPALTDVLLQIAAECGRRPALLISTDEQVKVVAHHGARLREHYAFDFPETAVVDLLMSKEAFTRLAAEKGWPIPATISVRTAVELRERLTALRFPVVLKPRVKNLASRQHTSQKAFRCPDAAALERAYDEVSRWEPEVVVQEWIPGSDADVFYSFHYFGADLQEICTFEGHKIRQWIPEVGSTASSEPVHPPRVTPLSRVILTTARCPGFCSVEYKRDPRTGTFYITEPTVGRVNLQLGTALANGADLVSRAYFHVHDLPYPGKAARTYDRKWVYLSADLQSARYYIGRGDLTWGGWLRSLRGPKEYAVWRAGDTGMVLGFMREWVTRVPRALLRRTRRLLGLPTPGR